MTVIQTASTNRPEIRITVPGMAAAKPAALLSDGNASPREIPYSSFDRQRLWAAVTAAGPLAGLPVSHCMKSVSFGTSLFVEVDGQRSPDLSCSRQTDPKAAALRAELENLLHAVAASRLEKPK